MIHLMRFFDLNRFLFTVRKVRWLLSPKLAAVIPFPSDPGGLGELGLSAIPSFVP